MATVTDTGITPTTLTEYQTLLRAAFKAAFGEAIDVDAKSPQGQFIDNLALSMSQSDDAVISVGGAVNIFRAFSAQIEGLATLIGIPKNRAESTIVTVTLGGTPGNVVPAGSRAKSDSGDTYQIDDDAQLDVGGVTSATMSAIETGPIELLAGELTSIVDIVPGWETVTNPADGVTGRNIESDSAYRQRYFTELFRNALSVLESMVSVISEQDNVVEVIGTENDTDSPITVQNVSIDPHSIAMVVEGGLDQDIADAIRLKKTGGTGTTGTTTVSDPPHADINFFRPDFIDLEVTISTTAGTNFPADGEQLLKERTLAYINGGGPFDPEPDLFELDGMKISEDLHKFRLYTPINSVPGHTVTALEMEDKAGGGDVETIVADLNEKIQFLSIDDINVNLS
jgi:uncharacterized phage protein gp47/JayE